MVDGLKLRSHATHMPLKCRSHAALCVILDRYHMLFMRLASYAGLHCVDIRGHSKSVGYEPGLRDYLSRSVRLSVRLSVGYDPSLSETNYLYLSVFPSL